MTQANNDITVLVTGGSGFIASHCILLLLQHGYTVRTTIRSIARESEVRSMLRVAGAETERLTFFEADLLKDAGWVEAMAGCSYVMHVASPTPSTAANNDDDFIIPANEGVLRVLRAARGAKVKRFVFTSAFGAICYAPNKTTPFTEEDWTEISSKVPPYQKSKTISEQTAWEFIRSEGNGMEMSVVNPTGVLGPVLGADYSHSIRMIHRMLNGEIPRCPKLTFGYVDVRDVADLHLRAMLHPAANGERFIAVAGEMISILKMGSILRSRLGKIAAKVPVKEMPNWLMHVIALFNKEVRFVTPHLRPLKKTTSAKAQRLLNWRPRPVEEAVIATGESLVKFGLVK